MKTRDRERAERRQALDAWWEQVAAEHAAGATQIELGAKYGKHPSRISVGLRRRGHWTASNHQDEHPAWTGESASYWAVHRRLRVVRGRAADHLCQCGGQAAQWAYQHDDPDERPSDQGPYSVDLAHYEPMCVPCHKRFDLDRP